MDTQYLILVDENDNILGYEEKEKCHTGLGLRHRAFVVCIFNSKDQILLQKRKHKRFDNVWDVSAISHPLHLSEYDESYEEASLRSLKTEIGIENVALKKIGGFNYFAKYGNQCENEYCAVLIGFYNGKVLPNMNVVYDCKWVEKQKFINDCKENPAVYAPWSVLASGVLTKK